MADLPEWAEKWIPGECGCGARLCLAACYCGGHITCSRTGRSAECNPRREKRSRPDVHRATSDPSPSDANAADQSRRLRPKSP